MKCVVTAGPTCEPLDEVRRLTNFSTGRLGTQLANYLVARGHQVTLLAGEQATYQGERRAQRIETFTTTDSLRELLRALSDEGVDAVFHAAAVSDFRFGKIWHRTPQGELTEVRSSKISTRHGTLVAELTPTPKVIAELRAWYPVAHLVGWKFQTEGDRTTTIEAAETQLAKCLTNACVANGPAYGSGFGLVTGPEQHLHLADTQALFEVLERRLKPS